MTLTLITVIFGSCQTRTSSDERFKKNIGIALPEEKTILKDEYQDMIQDYTIIYEVELSPVGNQQMINKIKALKPEHSEKECVWTFGERGFSYRCERNRTTFLVEYDSVTRKVYYEEGAD